MATAARRPRLIRTTMAGITAALLVPGLTAMALPSSSHAGAMEPNHLRRVPAQRPVPVRTMRFRRVPVPASRPWHAPAVSWPPAGSGVAKLSAETSVVRAGVAAAARVGGQRANAVLAGETAGSVRAGTQPVWVGPALHGTSSARQVRVGMQSRRLAAELGVSGVVFTLSQADTASAVSTVHVSLDYSAFAYADGGDFAARLHLVELPACALTTPAVPSCRRQVPVASGDDVATDQLGADVRLPAVTGAPVTGTTGSARPASAPRAGVPVVVMGATTAPSGSGGNFSATPLSDDGTWSAGGASGAFTYSYPITVPPVPGGLEPQVSLDYDSQSVDGLTSSTNDQASWIGDGWSYSPGFIERDYEPCSQTSADTGDLCWSGNDVTTLSLGGVTTTLVQDSSGAWQAENDQGDTISYETGSGSNATHDDDYWVVTDPTGTTYYFGLNELPGYASGDPETDSAWTAPVYATTSGQPCYNATFSDSHCKQAWRWNLDYETDADGNAIAYFYNSETNYYAADNGTTATAEYTQAGVVSKIEYGLRAGSVYGTTPAAEVTFTAPETRTDVPTGSSDDLACASGAACDVQSPTFWGKYQLTAIATEGLVGSSLEPADSWALAQVYQATNDPTTPPSLWLNSITRKGEDDGSAPLPAVSFAPIGLANRAQTPADKTDGYSLITRERIADVTNETGGTTEVTYDTVPTDCTSGNFPAPDDNTTLCYPDYWTPPDSTTGAVEDWFNKYVVMAVTQQSTEVSSQAEYTTYCYGTSSSCMSGAAWHFDDDPLTKTSQRTWDQWRGFSQVTTKTGVAPDPVTETVDTYFQGMNGDYQSGGGSTSASLSTTIGGVTVSATDNNQWAGMDFEHAVYDGAGGALVSAIVSTPYTSAATATQTGLPSPLPDLKAFLTGTAETQTFTALTSGGYREADEYFTHDSQGRVTVDEDVPDAYDDGLAGDSSEDTCTQTTYPSAGKWDLPSEIIVTSESPASCPVSGTPAKSVLISDTRYYYDGSTTLGAEPTEGKVTQTTEATSYSGSSEVFTVEDQKTYDEYGRVTSQTDADGNTTTTAYTPATGAEPTSVAVTSPATANAPDGLVTTTTYDPLRDLPLTITGPSGGVTTETYDALGRLTAVWTPGHPESSDPADETFSYDVSDTGPSVITTDTITSTGSYNPSEVLYDSLGREVETQTETSDGGRDVTDYTFNSDGWALDDYGPYYTTGAPSGTLVDAPAD